MIYLYARLHINRDGNIDYALGIRHVFLYGILANFQQVSKSEKIVKFWPVFSNNNLNFSQRIVKFVLVSYYLVRNNYTRETKIYEV